MHLPVGNGVGPDGVAEHTYIRHSQQLRNHYVGTTTINHSTFRSSLLSRSLTFSFSFTLLDDDYKTNDRQASDNSPLPARLVAAASLVIGWFVNCRACVPLTLSPGRWRLAVQPSLRCLPASGVLPASPARLARLVLLGSRSLRGTAAMPHLPARFRRSKKDKASKQHGDAPSTTSHLSSAGMLATPQDSSDSARQPRHAAQASLSLDTLASSDDTHAHAHAHHEDKHDRQGSPPSLSVTATTTPPSSSHSDQSNSSSIASSKSAPSAPKGSHGALHPLKSSFRGFHLRTNKRARSPASLHLQAPVSASGGNASHSMTASSPLGSSFPASPTSGGYGWNDEYSSQTPRVKLPAFLRLPLHG